MREMLKLGVPKEDHENSGIETYMRDEFASFYKEHICDRTKAFEGIPKLIDDLTKTGLKQLLSPTNTMIWQLRFYQNSLFQKTFL